MAGMRTWILAVLTGFVVVAPALAQPNDFTGVVGPLLGAVVNVASEHRPAGRSGREGAVPQLPPPFNEIIPQTPEGPDEPTNHGISLGSGFILDADGTVVTNSHVVEDTDAITVVLYDHRQFKAKLVGRDSRTDLAVLKIDAPEPLPHVEWGDSDAAQIGQWVLAIGNPFGLGGTVTAGIISAIARDIGAGPYDSFLQTDAAINRGNSGGPMFNIEGKVIGVNTAIFSPNGGSIGIGFAIPSSLAKPVVEQLRTTGLVKRGWLGVAIQAVTPEIADSLDLPKPEGAVVADITPGGPADQAGVRPGDVILRYDGIAIDQRHHLPTLVADSPIGGDAQLVIWRRGHEKTVTAHIGELQPEGAKAAGNPPPAGEPASLGLTVAPLTAEARNDLGLPAGEKGVLVRGVAAGSEAADHGVAPGDIIEQANQHPVATPAELRQALDQARREHRKTVPLLVRHGDSRHLVALPISVG